MCRRWGIRDIVVSAYNQQANGCGERSHRYLMAGISILWDRTKADWDDYINPVLFSSRVSVCESTGYSPYFLEHGDHASLPASLNMVVNTYDDYGTYEGAMRLRTNFRLIFPRKITFDSNNIMSHFNQTKKSTFG
jgi:hypothetical protein